MNLPGYASIGWKGFIRRRLARSKKIEQLVEKAESCIYAIFSPFFLIYFTRYYLKKIRELSHTDQIFILARGDFGYTILFYNAIHCWQVERGSTYLINLSVSPFAEKLAKLICPETKYIDWGPGGKWVLKFFRKVSFQMHTLCRVEGILLKERPDAQTLYMNPSSLRFYPRTSYVAALDPFLEQVDRSKCSEAFIQAYIRFRTYCQVDQIFHADYFRLQNKVKPLTPSQEIIDELSNVKKHLKIAGPYVLLNVNCKRYEQKQQRRSIQHPERYNSLVDYLIEKGLTVVIQGRSEQPTYAPRPGLIDYSKSSVCSMEADFALYSGCLFSIVSKSGPDSFNAVFDKPFLELNVVEFCYCRPGKKGRYFFKHAFSKKEDRFIPWHEIISSPIYFEASDLIFDKDLEYIEMSEDEIFQAGVEFMELIQEKKKWNDYSPEQQQFKSMLTPLHVDHFHVSSVPSHHYLKTCSYEIPNRINRCSQEVAARCQD